MNYKDLKNLVLEAAAQTVKRGAGYAQQRVVLEEVKQKLGLGTFAPMNQKMQEDILTCWHDLFQEGALSWGYDLDNPDAPFFHLPNRDGHQR